MGGRALSFESDGFKFDMGPTVITAPFLLEELFCLFGKSLKSYVDLVPVHPWYRIQFDDGSVFDYGGTIEQTLEQIRLIDPAETGNYLRLLEKCRQIFDVGFTELGAQPFCTFDSMIRVLPQMVRLGSHKSVYDFVGSFVTNEKLRKIFSFHPLLVGGNPYNTTSIYSLIHFLEREYGIHFAMGGTAALVAGLERLMREEGIEILTDSTVEEVETAERQVRAVRLTDGTRIRADIVVWNGCPSHLYKRVLPTINRKKWTDRKVASMRHSMGLFVLFLGVDREYPNLAHHTIMFGGAYKELLEDIFERKVLSDDISVYLHAPTRTDPSLAPRGHESLYVLCPVPNLQSEIDWQEQGPVLRGRILEMLERRLMPELSRHIVTERYITPEYFKQNLLSEFGAGFSVQPTLLQSAYYRYHNRSEEVDGLYLVGAGTHPGAGIPGVLCSAKVTSSLVEKYHPLKCLEPIGVV